MAHGSYSRTCLPVTKAEQRKGIGRRSPGVVGLDLLRQRADAVRVTKVELVGVHPAGSLAIARAFLVPGGTVGASYGWRAKILTGTSHWGQRIEVPSRTPLRRQDLPADNRAWQVVIGLTYRGNGGTMDAVRLTVEADGDTSTLTTFASASLVRRPGGHCDDTLPDQS